MLITIASKINEKIRAEGLITTALPLNIIEDAISAEADFNMSYTVLKRFVFVNIF